MENDEESIPKETLKKMLLRENELRLSEEYQKKYEEAEKSWKIDWLKVTENLQLQILQEFEISNLSKGLFQLRTATVKFPEFKSIPLYVKFNRSRVGNLKIGNEAPSMKLSDLEGNMVELIDKNSKCQLIFGGSYS
jgi:hypothetical protein